MYKVVLVDDDVLVIEFLKRFIPWEDYGFKVVAHFNDSTLALAYLQENPFDVLFTDIGMPKLNGIELIEHLKKSKINSNNIILSCHDEFHYAQQALKLEVFDYILKETIEESNIIALLERLKNKLDEERYTNNQQLIVTHFLEKNNLALKSKFIEKLMKEQELETTSWFKEQEELLGMDFSHERYTPVLCFIDHYQEAINHFENETSLQFSINNILEEVSTNAQRGVQIFFLHNQFYILIRDNKTTDTKSMVESILKAIHFKLRTILKVSITSVIGKQNVRSQELIKNMRLLLNNKEQRFYYQYDSIQYFAPIVYTNESIFQNYVEISSKIRELVLKDRKDKLMECISQQLNLVKEKKYSPAVIKDWVIKLIYDIKLSLNVLNHFDGQSPEIKDHDIQHVETIEHLEGVLEVIFHKFCEHLQSSDLSSRNEDILKAQKYVQIHLSEKISLKDVADHLHLNSSYFSRMFKKETGEGFVEYVTKVKMAKAIELLDHSSKSVEQIAYELGFDNKSYFLKTFKKFYGVSPKSYRYKDKESV